MKEASKQLPLKIECEEKIEKEQEFNQEFINRMIERIDWNSFCAAAQSLEVGDGLPSSKDEIDSSNEELMKKIHHALMEIDVVKGSLVCTETGREC
eukprot:761207-Hanusia_phi.AAC.3